jgi:hypothetical protein
MECGRYRSVRGVGKARLDWVGWVKPNRSDIVVTFQWSRAEPVGCVARVRVEQNAELVTH